MQVTPSLASGSVFILGSPIQHTKSLAAPRGVVLSPTSTLQSLDALRSSMLYTCSSKPLHQQNGIRRQRLFCPDKDCRHWTARNNTSSNEQLNQAISPPWLRNNETAVITAKFAGEPLAPAAVVSSSRRTVLDQPGETAALPNLLASMTGQTAPLSFQSAPQSFTTGNMKPTSPSRIRTSAHTAHASSSPLKTASTASKTITPLASVSQK